MDAATAVTTATALLRRQGYRVERYVSAGSTTAR